MKRFTKFFLLLAAALLTGCAVYREGPPPPVAAANLPRPLTLTEIKEMSARGVSDQTIISALSASRAVYRLTSQEVKELQQAEVSPAVIDYLLKTPETYKQARPRYRASYYYYPYPPPPYYPVYPFGFHGDFFYDFHHGHHW